MNVLISLGPIIGVIILFLYSLGIKLYQVINGKKEVKKKQFVVYVFLVALEIILVCISVFVPQITGKSYLLEGMSENARIVITPYTFKVCYEESKRNYSNLIFIKEEELSNVQALCDVDEGRVFLRITQDDIQTVVDITNTEMILNLSEYKEGNIRFTLIGEAARNVDFELLW